MSLDQARALALENRPDLQSSNFTVKNKNLELVYARNQLLPALNLNASYWSPGLSGSQVLFLDDNPLTGHHHRQDPGRRLAGAPGRPGFQVSRTGRSI